MDIFQKCYEYDMIKQMIAADHYPYFLPLSESEGTIAEYKGRKLIMCGSNNYLGLTTHPKVREAAIQAIEKYGTSCTGSRFLNGSLEMHEQLEHEIAEYVGKESALVFSTGMQVNLGTISSLIGRQDVAILDKDAHASIYDGVKLSYGKMERFAHNDMAHLRRVLESIPESAGKLIIVDGLFSMEGDLAKLDEIVPLAKEFGARLMVDDAHGIGVTGGGRGTSAQFGLTDEVDLIMSTFSKSFASLGGFIAGDEDIVHYIKHNARSMIFSASIQPASAAAALMSLKIMREEPEINQQLIRNGAKMREGFQKLGFDIGHSVTPVVPIVIGNNEQTFGMARGLFDKGVYVNSVISPAVPAGRQMLRTSYMATHTAEQLDLVLEIFEEVGKEVGLI
jgi:8-amino-7-oxononanoate synthase